jgi:hypothetical protein
MEDLPSDTDTPVESNSDEEQQTGNSNVGSSESQNMRLSDTDSSDDVVLSEYQSNWKKEAIINIVPVFLKEVGPFLQHFVEV